MKKGIRFLLRAAAIACAAAALAGPVSAEEQQPHFLNTKTGTFYLEPKGGKMTVATGFRRIKGLPYYFFTEASGRMARGQMASGLQKIRGSYYYFYTYTNKAKGFIRGQMASGFAQVPSSKGPATMYFYPSGSQYGQAATGGLKTINGKRYYFSPSGILQTGVQIIGGKGYYFAPNGSARGQMQTGWQTVNGKTYYFGSDGAAVRGWQTIDGTAYYFGNNYALTSRKVNNRRESDECGTMEEKTLWRAQIIVSQIIKPTMTKREKLWTCFEYVCRNYEDTGGHPRVPHYLGMDWPAVYANDMFLDGGGNCCSFAGAFAYLVKACGYEVYACNSTGHGWVEIDGLVYDPEVYHRQFKTLYFGKPYTELRDPSGVNDYWAIQQLWLNDPVRYANLHVRI